MADWAAEWKKGNIRLDNEKLADWWGRTHHKYYHRWVINSDYIPRVFARLQPLLESGDSVLELGAGSGAFTPSLAQCVRSVTAVEPAEAMTNLLEQRLAEAMISNVTLVKDYIENAKVAPHDVVFGSHCFWDMDIAVVIPKITALARRRVVLVTTLGDEHPSAFTRFKHRYRDRMICFTVMYNYIHEMGYLPTVDFVDVEGTWVYDRKDEFFEHWSLFYANPDRLEHYPGCFLEERDGKYHLRYGYTTAIISYSPRVRPVSWFGSIGATEQALSMPM